jgi:cell wall-associated NlpC family hydrolase
MKSILFSLSLLTIIVLSSCSSARKISKPVETNSTDIHSKVIIKKKVPIKIINTKNVTADELVDFAETLIGVKYKYGSAKKENGFDCSGFINYVFNHFNIPVPRISYDFTNAGKEVPIKESKRGDIILFTGSDPKSGVVGHMGIVTENKKGDLQFIHASESRGVMISGMNSYFVPRFVKVNRIFLGKE